MRTSLFILCMALTLSACDTPEPGAPDIPALSKKLFDAIRENDFDKTVLLMPDKGTYRKIIENRDGIEISEAGYDSMVVIARQHFDSLQLVFTEWKDSKFEHAQYDLSKGHSYLSAITTVKFSSKTIGYKFNYSCYKYNSKWFYMGDAVWVVK